MTRRHLRFAAIAAALALSLSGCSSAGSSGTDADGNTTINWSVWAGSEVETAAWQKLADMVHEKDPTITVKLTTAAWPDYWTKLPTTLAGNDAPCIAGLQMARVQQFANYFVPLGDQLDAAGIDTADFDPSIISALQAGGEQMAIPYDLGPYVVFYNKDAFAAAGLENPKDGWTLSEFETAAKALTKDGKYGFATTNQIDAMNQWGPTIGGDQAATEDGKLNLTSAGQEKTMAWYSSLVNEQGVAAQLATDSSDGSQFLAGNAAMYVTGPWDMINAKDQAKFDVGIVTVPTGDEGAATAIGGSGFGITTKCSTPEVAAKALAIITGTDAQAYLGTEGRAFPARTSEQSTWYSAAVDGAQSTLEASLKTGVPYLSTPTWTQDGLSFSQGSISVINGQTDPKSFLESVESGSGSAG
ncbi:MULTISPECIES: ABC transporter substrate-binding protein [unclassified Rathayibacter]|uniref:ABC transporter substrate-binding protein n=1 Tax=unclassified Rathayibacter TaxID=2609250 RepID=UPI000700C72B|nr:MULTISPECIES: sugar ABC transporter substrate-binding protein [unclassified Rathayibacter]KQQ05457.1 hypothetical protein ASF42_02420 [Rathayibacter sp. Leaf294]KQS13320.1 hypothetical protein ASG06_02430 [Rathayibacter sp. Leaf185]